MKSLPRAHSRQRFAGVNGGDSPQKYENTFQISMPEADRFDSAQPSQLKALAAAVTPAVNGIVADISPYKESRELVAIEGGDERVVYLLNAKAFLEVVTVVEKLDVTGKANFADFENLGIAQEAMGDFFRRRSKITTTLNAIPDSCPCYNMTHGQHVRRDLRNQQNRHRKFLSGTLGQDRNEKPGTCGCCAG